MKLFRKLAALSLTAALSAGMVLPRQRRLSSLCAGRWRHGGYLRLHQRRLPAPWSLSPSQRRWA